MNPNHNGNDSELMETNVDYFVTETTIKRSVPIERLIAILRARKTTGDLCVYFNEGGIRRIELHERTKAATKGARDQIRQILGME